MTPVATTAGLGGADLVAINGSLDLILLEECHSLAESQIMELKEQYKTTREGVLSSSSEKAFPFFRQQIKAYSGDKINPLN